jgi:hypothetical protein
MHHQACQRVPVQKVFHLLPAKYIEALEQNQQIAACCRHPENHEIEALYSSDADRDKGVPDIYIFHCTCGRKHRRFCIGGDHPADPTKLDKRPFWEVR